MTFWQVIWGLFLSGLLGYSFYRAWRWEHGAKAQVLFAEKYGVDTYVFVPPTVLFWILLVFLVLYVCCYGMQDGFVRFIALTVDVLLLLSLYFLLLLLLLPLLRKAFSARACALLWLVPAFLSWQAGVLIRTMPLPRWTLYIPRRAILIIGGIWLAGFFTVGGYYLISDLLFRTWVNDHTTKEYDAAVLAVWEQERGKLEWRRKVTLMCGDVSAPFSMGQTNSTRCTVLPKRDFTPEELSMIFRHELHHLQRCDVDTKVFLCLCNALGWFNPLVWIATKKAAEDLERSCDEIVTEEMGEEERKAYAQLLLRTAAPGKGCTTCLSAAAGTLRYRLRGVMEPGRRLLGTVLLMLALFGCVMSFGWLSVSDEKGSFTELVLTPDAEITRIYNKNEYDSAGWDRSALQAVLDGIELEHIAGLRAPVLSGEEITFWLSGGRIATLTKQALIVQDFHRHKSRADCYLIKNEIDWEALRACLK